MSKEKKVILAGKNVNSISMHWCTPSKYIKPIKDFFGGKIDLDPCSNSFSTVGAGVEFKLPKNDGLAEKWSYKNIFVNPPYGRDRIRGTSIYDWSRKCTDTHYIYGSEILALIPVETNKAHWKDYIFDDAAGICFLKEYRLKFVLNGNNNNRGTTMPYCIVYWGKNLEKFYWIFNEFGKVVFISDSLCPINI